MRAVPDRHAASGGVPRSPGRARRRPPPGARPPCRPRRGDDRCVDLRPRPDRSERGPVGAGQVAALRCGTVKDDGPPMSATPVGPPRRSSSSPSTAARSRSPKATPLLAACAGGRRRHPHAVLRPDHHAGQRLPGVRRRARGLADPRAGLLASGRDGHGRAHRHRAGEPDPRRLVLELLGSSVDLSTTTAARRWIGALRRRSDRASATTPPPCEQPVKDDNDLYVRDYAKCILCYQCVDACGVAVAAHVRHRRGRTWLRRPHLDRVRRRAARLGVRLLRQLHRRVPDRGADAPNRVDDARRGGVGRGAPDRAPTRSAPTAASAATSPCTCRTTASSR